jgi:hypothetical protein
MQASIDTISVRDFGATGDGVTLDSAAIQAAIDACAANKGGTVYFPAGDYLTGTLILKENVTLKLAAQARLLGSTSLQHYPEMQAGGYCLLYAQDAHHIQLCGEGVIDGQGKAFPYGAEGFNIEDEAAAPTTQTFIRPQLMHLKNCRDVVITGLTLQHAASWCCHIDACREVRIDGVHLFNRANQNNDGFDLTDCEDVVVSNCHVDCGDDAFALKEGGIRIAITNCHISTRWAAFRIGPEARRVFRDIVVSNCVVYNTYGCGIKMQEVEGGVMENILFNNIVMDSVTGPISLRLGGYLGWKNERKESLPIGVLRNVRFSNIHARVADNAYPLPHEVPAFPGERKSCITLTGVPGFYIENVTFSGVDITFPGGGSQEDAHAAVPELRDHYPEYHMFGTLPAYGMYVRHVKGLRLDDVRFGIESADLRPALACEDVEDLELAGFRAEANADADALITLKAAYGVFAHDSRALGPVKVFIRAEDAPGILLDGNDLRQARVSIYDVDRAG